MKVVIPKVRQQIERRCLPTVLLIILLSLQALGQPYSWPSWQAQTALGNSFSSRQLDGKVVVVSVWGSWCPSCRRQLPILNALQSKYDAQDFQVLTFSLDRSDAVHRQFVKDQNIEVPSIYAREGDGLRVVKMLQHGAGTLEAVPTVLIYDKKGQLAHRLVGFFNHRQLSELVEPLLEER
ncbi:MAG TPA: TlpA family protein disulfide reductase [Phycisphaerales bacterium]|nr:TlpA family protein disulfide reductase [Phycisphaerales bacterium]